AILRKRDRELDVGVVRVCDELGQPDMPEHAARQARAQEAAFVGDDWQATLERLQRGVEAREAERVEVKIGLRQHAAEVLQALPRQEGHLALEIQPCGSERRVQSSFELARKMRRLAAKEHQPRAR